MAEQRVLNEVPEVMKRLVKSVVTGFYTVECAIVMEMLIQRPGIGEDSLDEYLKFDKKQLRSVLNTLKQEQFINCKIQMETGPDNKSTRHYYYYINYSNFVNVVKYKLDQVRRKIEAVERDKIIRASFRCPRCYKTFTDLEVGQLFDYSTNTYNCTYCTTEVEEEAVDGQNVDARTLMAKFNEQMEPIFNMLKELEGIKLADNLLEPPLEKDLRSSRPGFSNKNDDKTVWSGDATKNMSYGISSSRITISMDDENSKQSLPAREVPIWSKDNVVEAMYAASKSETAGESSGISAGLGLSVPALTKDAALQPDLDDMMKTLLYHEKPVVSSVPQLGRTNEEEDGGEEMESEEDQEFTVTIGGRRVPYNEITNEMISNMNPSEKEEYIRVGKEMHEFYD